MSQKLNISESERQRRSDLARSLHAAGKFGGAQPNSGRAPRKRRAIDKVAEDVAGMATEISDALRAGLAPNQPASVRVNAAKEALKIERDHAELTLKEERQLDQMTAEQMIEYVLNKVARVGAAGALPDHFGEALVLDSTELDDDD